jgi:hypothetical protein
LYGQPITKAQDEYTKVEVFEEKPKGRINEFELNRIRKNPKLLDVHKLTEAEKHALMSE